MKNLLVANYRPHGKTSENGLRALIEAQIENSLAVGWAAKDIVVVTNLEIAAPVTVVQAPLNAACLTGSKMFALEHLFALGLVQEGETWWAHDLDAWQNMPFEAPAFADIGLTEYSSPSFNGGSVFLRAGARDLIRAIADHIRRAGLPREEPAIDFILRQPANAARVTVLNSTYNVGCSAYGVRYGRSELPVRVSHFHPSGISWRTHVWGWNRIDTPSVSPRLSELLVRHFHGGVAPAPTEKDWQRRENRRHYRLRESFHLGDSWARLNYALRLLEQGEQFSLYLPNRLTKDILASLELGARRPHLLTARRKPDRESQALFRRIDEDATAYGCRYFPTKVRHRAEGKVIGYCFDAQWKSADKIPPGIDRLLADLRAALPGYRFQPMGKPHQETIPEVIQAMAGLELLLSVDNGIAQVARSVNVPLFLLEHLQPLSRGFPPAQCGYGKVTVDDAVEKVVAYLARG